MLWWCWGWHWQVVQYVSYFQLRNWWWHHQLVKIFQQVFCLPSSYRKDVPPQSKNLPFFFPLKKSIFKIFKKPSDRCIIVCQITSHFLFCWINLVPSSFFWWIFTIFKGKETLTNIYIGTLPKLSTPSPIQAMSESSLASKIFVKKFYDDIFLVKKDYDKMPVICDKST